MADMGYADAYSIVSQACVTREQQLAFEVLISERNAYVKQCYELTKENEKLTYAIEQWKQEEESWRGDAKPRWRADTE